MLFIPLTIIFSYIYIFLRKLIVSKTLLDKVFTPFIFWIISLASLENFVFFSRLGLVGGVPMVILMWQVISIWVDYVSNQSGNKKLKKDKDRFKNIILAPVNAIMKLWNAIVTGLSSGFDIISVNWNNMVKVYTDMLNLVTDSFKFLSDSATKLWYEIVISFKELWNQNLKLAKLAVTMGGTIDEDIIPPLPDPFLSKSLIEKGKFWKFSNGNTIYWSQDKTKNNKDQTFPNIETYNNFRKSNGLSDDSILANITKINVPSLPFRFKFKM